MRGFGRLIAGALAVVAANEMFHVSAAIIEARFKKLAKTAHTDVGGSAEAMAELNRARDEALQEIKR